VNSKTYASSPDQIKLNDTINNKSITIDNNSNANTTRIDLFKNSGGGIVDEAIINANTSDQFLLVSHTDNAENNSIRITSTNAGDATIAHTNTFLSATNPFVIEATNTNLKLSAPSGTAALGSIIFEPNTSSGDLIFNGANIESNSYSGPSGKFLRIKLNGLYYKINLDVD
jgi:hypothetical protein